jgi:hypothetical protein
MPTEVRQIIFQTNEVVAAIREYRRRHNLSLPTGRVHAVNIKAAGIAVLGVIDGTGVQREEVVIEAEELFGALLLFCKERHIPLPSTGQKTVQKHGQSVTLMIAMFPKHREIRDDPFGYDPLRFDVPDSEHRISRSPIARDRLPEHRCASA